MPPRLEIETEQGILNEDPIVSLTTTPEKTLQRTAEDVAGFLAGEGLRVRAYHAGMRAEARAEVQDGFMEGSIEIVVATIAFGMGIDKADIRYVYHYNLPKSLENYVQESGRAGRDGEDAICEILACGDDRIVLENFVYGDTPSDSAVKSLVEHLLLQGDEFDISRYDLSGTLDIRPLVVGEPAPHVLRQPVRGVEPANAPILQAHCTPRRAPGRGSRRRVPLRNAP